MKYIINGAHYENCEPAEAGGKASALAVLQKKGFPVPPWFVVKTNAFYDSLPQSENSAEKKDSAGKAVFDWSGKQSEESADIEYHYAVELFSKASPSQAVASEIDTMLAQFDDGIFFAVRSSAANEDGTVASFAGQYESYLWVPKDKVAEHVQLVWQSACTERISEYRKSKGITGKIEPPAVLIQKMVRSEKAGVAFSTNPLNGDSKTCVISAVFGLGSALVDGSSDADTYHYNLATEQIAEVNIAEKDLHAEPLNKTLYPHWFLSPGETEALAKQQVLTDEEIREVARSAARASQSFGRDQDLEWAFEEGRFYLLQSRPITTLAGMYEEFGRSFIFDNSNIAESYSGTTTPLTFSFIRKAYTGVYEQFCRVFGVTERTIAENNKVFSQTLAFVDNHVYYNLYSWYKMISLLPGYTLNQKFMEQMMGVKEPLPKDFLKMIHDSVPRRTRLQDTWQVIRCFVKLIHNFNRLDKHIEAFLKRLNETLDTPDLQYMSASELYDTFAAMEQSLLKRWDAPIENDFFAMIFHGLLRSQCEKHNLPSGFHNDLLTGQGGIISAKPAAMIKVIAAQLYGDQETIDVLATGSLAEIEEMLQDKQTLKEQTESYLNLFGDRCIDELKLESISLTIDPLPFYRTLAAAAVFTETSEGRQAGAITDKQAGGMRSDRSAGDTMNDRSVKAPTAPDPPLAASQKELWIKYFKGKPFSRRLFRFVLKHARRTVKNRENLRFERTRLFGKVRMLFLAMGQQFASRDIIAENRDIFYLTLEEIMGAIDMTGTSWDLKGTVALRKEELALNSQKELPSRIFAAGIAGFSGRKYSARSTAAVVDPQEFQTGPESKLQSPDHDLNTFKGIPCCPGQVTGRARVVKNPTGGNFAKGDILVARSTDPGWIVLFSLASAIIVERGSLLSHAAIVSREMGLPCIVSADGATKKIPDGANVSMDGATGEIRILSLGNKPAKDIPLKETAPERKQV